MKKVISLFVFTAILAMSNLVLAQVTILTGFQGATYFEMAKDLEKIAPPLINTASTPEVIQVPDPESLEGGTKDSSIIRTTADTTNFLKVLTSDGAYYNFIKLERADVDVAFLQYDVLLYEEMKDLTRKFKKTENIRILLSMGSEQIHLITRRDNKNINKLSDLKGKQVGIGSSMQGTNITAKFIREKTKINWKEVEIPYDRAFRALLVGDIDAFFFVGAAPVSSLNRLSPNLKDQIKLLPVEHESLKSIYEETTMAAGTYTWLTENIKTYNIKTVLVCSVLNETPEKADMIDKFLQLVKNNLGTLQDPKKAHPNWKNVNFGQDGIEWEFHPMAKKYMK
jgi:TRAP transporter TAXI family solute receptor